MSADKECSLTFKAQTHSNTINGPTGPTQLLVLIYRAVGKPEQP